MPATSTDQVSGRLSLQVCGLLMETLLQEFLHRFSGHVPHRFRLVAGEAVQVRCGPSIADPPERPCGLRPDPPVGIFEKRDERLDRSRVFHPPQRLRGAPPVRCIGMLQIFNEPGKPSLLPRVLTVARRIHPITTLSYPGRCGNPHLSLSIYKSHCPFVSGISAITPGNFRNSFSQRSYIPKNDGYIIQEWF